MRNLAMIVLFLSALLAGCAGDETTDTPVVAPTPTNDPVALNNTTALPTLPVTLEFQGCLQLRTFFPLPSALLTQLGVTMPPGFTLASANGQTVDVFIAWWSCPSGLLNNTPNGPFEAVGSVFAALPVNAPSDLTARDPNVVAPQFDLLPLTWIISNPLAARHLDEIPGLAGGFVENGDVFATLNANAGTLVSRGMTAQASFGTFDVDAIFQAASAENPASRYRMWLVPDEGNITGYLDIFNTAGTTLGSGQADLRFQGDATTGAPPIMGGMSRVVDATGVVMVVVALDP